MTIQAIQTRYGGCHFRSRLEARWAVFFDHLGIAWEYEPQGFEVSSGCYLPDFYLPEVRKWIEVKASVGAIGHDSWQRMQDFANEVAMPNDRFQIIFSVPRSSPIWTASWTGPIGPGGPMPISEQLVDGCGHVFMGFIPSLWITGGNRGSVSGALTAARSARFEHGAQG